MARHSLGAARLAGLGMTLLHVPCSRFSDGVKYATAARNYLEGRGLASSVIQPGPMTLV